MECDVLITGGMLIDGSGAAGVMEDIAVRGDAIVARGELAGAVAAEVVAAAGLCVCPGFIDIHAHSEFNVLIDAGRSKVMQGVTTEVCGNCGVSAAPLQGMTLFQRRQSLAAYGLDPDWSTLRQYAARVEQTGLLANIAMLVGHGNLRGSVIGYENVTATDDHLRDMRALLVRELEAGAWGLSSGLIYPPGVFSHVDELAQLAAVVKQYGGLYTTHIRNEGYALLESVAEALAVGLRAGIPVQISHLKTMDRRNWHKLPDVLALIERARNEGADVTADRYPYTASSTGLDALLPAWACRGGNAAELARLQNMAERMRMLAELFARKPADEIGAETLISRLPGERNAHLQGRTLAEAAELRGQEVGDALCDLLVEEALDIDAVFFCMNEDNLRTILQQSWVMVGSDASAWDAAGPLSRGMPHPRGFGSFPRVLATFVRAEKLLGIETAINKMTALPAERMGFTDRGLIEPGRKADIVLFDPAAVADTATYAAPKQFPVGIRRVMVNGTWVVADGVCNASRPGALLRKC